MAYATSNEWLNNLKVGDAVFFVGERGRTTDETVEKIGSKIIHTSTRKYLKENGFQQVSAGHIGRIYPNKEAYEAHRQLEEGWMKLRNKISSTYQLPVDMSQEKMDQIFTLIYGAQD